MRELDIVQKYIQEDFSNPVQDSFLEEFLLTGSKKIRSKLAILYLKSAGCEIPDSIYNILAAGEIIHNASLLHDDVLDEAKLRRGKETPASRFSPKLSILAGDYLIAFAIEKLLELNNRQILEIFKDCTKQMSEAEIKQFFLRGKMPETEEYLNICKGKTAALFCAVLESCSLECGLEIEPAKRFGEVFGLYFQIKNDLEEESAKTDKDNGIFTAKDILGIEKTTVLLDNCRKEMRDLLRRLPEPEPKRELEELFSK